MPRTLNTARLWTLVALIAMTAGAFSTLRAEADARPLPHVTSTAL